jgi:hypothetical protein
VPVRARLALERALAGKRLEHHAGERPDVQDNAEHAYFLPRCGLRIGLPGGRLQHPEADALVIGEGRAVWRVLTAVWPTLEKARFWCDSARPRPNLAMYGEGTLILENVDKLETSDQQRILEWCSGTEKRSRVIATASRQFVTLVKNGGFSRRPYDCLKSAQLLLM